MEKSLPKASIPRNWGKMKDSIPIWEGESGLSVLSMINMG